MLSKTKKLTKGGDNIGRIVIMEFKAKKYVGKFEAAMEDDFNTADAIAAIFELVKYVNTNKTDSQEIWSVKVNCT